MNAEKITGIIGGLFNGIKVDDWDSKTSYDSQSATVTLKRGDERHVFTINVNEENVGRTERGETPGGDKPKAGKTADTGRC